ncbi:MAG: ATP-binding cassette domain-containing protein [Firmicutes bacterium]|nr:ATP-binding cassette domain-containing protein [Bacillota bacterium]
MSLLQIRQVSKIFTIKRLGVAKRAQVKAVNNISLEIFPNETLGLVGESGCGKTTLGRLVCRLIAPTQGQILYKGRDIFKAEGSYSQQLCREIQMVFQDPYGSLNPRKSIETILATPLRVHKITSGSEIRRQVVQLLEQVGLSGEMSSRYPPQLSGGQLQRVAIARALSLKPQLLVADEPLSALDVSIQAQLINLLKRMQRDYQLSMLFISHDLSIVRYISHRVAVMYLGCLVELAGRDELYANPLHPYTKALLSSVPVPNPKIEATRQRIVLEGDVPSPMNLPRGCPFHARCPVALRDLCTGNPPQLEEVDTGHWVACHRITGY